MLFVFLGGKILKQGKGLARTRGHTCRPGTAAGCATRQEKGVSLQKICTGAEVIKNPRQYAAGDRFILFRMGD